MATSTFRSTADAIAYVLGDPPQRVDWAVALVYVDNDGSTETRYFEADDEQDARREAEVSNLKAMERGPGDGSLPDRAYSVFQEVRMLPDGTQIISPWMAPANQFLTEGR